MFESAASSEESITELEKGLWRPRLDAAQSLHFPAPTLSMLRAGGALLASGLRGAARAPLAVPGGLRPAADSAALSAPSTAPFREFSKVYGNAMRKRMPLSPKRARKGYYKGKGARSEGRHTSKGGYLIDPAKRLELVIPDMDGFKVRDCANSGASVPG